MPDTPLSNQLILHELDKVASAPAVLKKRHLVFEKGAQPFDSFDTAEQFYFIMDGSIKISQINPENGREQTLYLLSRGDMFDVVTLLDSGSHEYVAEVMERTEVVEVSIAQVRALLESDSEFRRFFLPYVAQQLRTMENLAVDLSLYDVYGRIVRLFARFVENSDGTPRLRLINHLSHEELASMVGSVRKVVNRALQRLKDEGVIELSRKQLQLKNLKKLLDKL